MTPTAVLRHYSIGKVQTLDRISSGLIHTSYRVKTNQGFFLLQHLHPQLSARAFTKDYRAVTTFLTKRGVPTQKVMASRNGQFQLKDRKRAWRLLTFLPGTVLEALRSATDAYVLGVALGQFHTQLQNFPYRFTAPLRIHDTPVIIRALSRTLKNKRYRALLSLVQSEAQFLQQTLPTLLLPKTLPRRVIHGDPKATNFVFTSPRRATLIDLDTCTRHTLLVDLGDALRSWCAPKEDGQPNFRLAYFQAALRGYRKESVGLLTAVEQRFLVQGVFLITLELASRFLMDYFENSYFGWDSQRYKNRRAHNLARLRGMIYLYRSMHRDQARMDQAVRQIFGA